MTLTPEEQAFVDAFEKEHPRPAPPATMEDEGVDHDPEVPAGRPNNRQDSDGVLASSVHELWSKDRASRGRRVPLRDLQHSGWVASNSVESGEGASEGVPVSAWKVASRADDFADEIDRGWELEHTKGGHMRLVKGGHVVTIAKSASDHRADLNAKSFVRQCERGVCNHIGVPPLNAKEEPAETNTQQIPQPGKPFVLNGVDYYVSEVSDPYAVLHPLDGKTREIYYNFRTRQVEAKVKTAGMTRSQRLRKMQELEASGVIGPDSSTVVHTFPNGYTIRKLNTMNDRNREGQLAHHCWADSMGNATEMANRASQLLGKPVLRNERTETSDGKQWGKAWSEHVGGAQPQRGDYVVQSRQEFGKNDGPGDPMWSGVFDILRAASPTGSMGTLVGTVKSLSEVPAVIQRGEWNDVYGAGGRIWLVDNDGNYQDITASMSRQSNWKRQAMSLNPEAYAKYPKSATVEQLSQIYNQDLANGYGSPFIPSGAVLALELIPLSAIEGKQPQFDDRGEETRQPQISGESWDEIHDTEGDYQGLEQGIRQAADVPPLIVMKQGNAYLLQDGNHRASIARSLGLTEFPAYVYDPQQTASSWVKQADDASDLINFFDTPTWAPESPESVAAPESPTPQFLYRIMSVEEFRKAEQAGKFPGFDRHWSPKPWLDPYVASGDSRVLVTAKMGPWFEPAMSLDDGRARFYGNSVPVDAVVSAEDLADAKPEYVRNLHPDDALTGERFEWRRAAVGGWQSPDWENMPKYDPRDHDSQPDASSPLWEGWNRGWPTAPDSLISKGYSEMVPTEHVDQAREFDRAPGEKDFEGDPQKWNGLKAHMQEYGMMSPIIMHYNPDTGESYVAEGNHRIQAAKEIGMSHVPVVMYRHKRGVGYGGRGVKLEAPFADQPHVPQYIRPSQVGLPVQEPVEKQAASEAVDRKYAMGDLVFYRSPSNLDHYLTGTVINAVLGTPTQYEIEGPDGPEWIAENMIKPNRSRLTSWVKQ